MHHTPHLYFQKLFLYFQKLFQRTQDCAGMLLMNGWTGRKTTVHPEIWFFDKYFIRYEIQKQVVDKNIQDDIMYLYNKYTLHIKKKRRWSMEIIISNNANKPIYEQITSQIKAMIMSGELQPGGRDGYFL